MPRRVPVGLFRLVRRSSSDRTRRPQDIGLALAFKSSARENIPAMQLPQGGYFEAAVIH
jgi:hypothetical protein